MTTDRATPLAIAVHPINPDLTQPTARRTMRLVAVAVAAGALSTGLVIPLSVLALVASSGVLGFVVMKMGAGPLRAALAEYAVRRARQARRAERERRLRPASIGYHVLTELTDLVDDIEDRAPELAQRFDLEALLDRHVTLTLALERAQRAAGMSDRIHLEHMRDGFRSDPTANPRRLELCERRLRCLAQCEARAAGYADQLAILSDTLHLIDQHVACPDDPLPDETIERHLAELDDHEAARRQLASELS